MLTFVVQYFEEFRSLTGWFLFGKYLAVFALVIQVYALISPIEKTTKSMASISSISWAGAFLISGSFSAAAMALLSSIRQGISAYLVGSGPRAKIVFATIFITVSCLIGALTYENFYSLLPVAAGVISTYAYFFASNKNMRWILLLSAQLWLVTHWQAGIEEGVLSVVLSSSASLIGLYRVGQLEQARPHPAQEER